MPDELSKKLLRVAPVMYVKNANDAKAGDHPFTAKVFPQRLGMGVLGANFKSTSFLSIDAVGPGFLESITRVDQWWHSPKMTRRFVG